MLVLEAAVPAAATISTAAGATVAAAGATAAPRGSAAEPAAGNDATAAVLRARLADKRVEVVGER
ncbi:hypothetical protein, partial [Streptomyces sp. SID337]|uniref:hypothetical protein n=1 Tax=Streptomyces sp. SID337 TaxID=2690262 RepID=UPI0013853CB1